MKLRNITHNKRAQNSISLSFNWLFAIILIAVFIFAAIYGIKYFLNISSCSNIGMSLGKLQDEVDNAFFVASRTDNFPVELSLPGVEKICFADLSQPVTGDLDVYDQINFYLPEDGNTFLIPPEKSCSIPIKMTKYIDINQTTSIKNPYCIDVEKGKATIILKKDYYDKAVTIK